MPGCGLVILAAGGSTRMGTAKQLLPLDGMSLLAHAARVALASMCRPVAVVVGARAEEMKRELASLDVRLVVNDRWSSGIGSSIRAGVALIAATRPRPDAVCVFPCDQPLVSAGAIDRLVQARQASGKPICAACYAGTLGTPAVFAAALFDELTAAADDEGGKAVILRHSTDVLPISLPEAATDIDTAAEYRDVIGRMSRGQGPSH